MINKILISQPTPLSKHNQYFDMEQSLGVHFDFHQLIQIEGLEVQEFRKQRINPIDYPSIIFNSRQSIDHYFRLCESMKLTVPTTMNYYCISEAIGNYLQKYVQYRKRRVFFSEHNKIEELVPFMLKNAEDRYLMVTSDIHSDDDINMFAANNLIVQPAIMYRTVPIIWPSDKPFDYDMIVLFSPMGIQSIRKNFPKWKQGKTLIACFGYNTIQAVKDSGYKVSIQAPTAKYSSITQALKDYLETHLSQI